MINRSGDERSKKLMAQCVNMGWLDRIEQFVQGGFDINATIPHHNGECLWPALHAAVMGGSVETCEKVIALGADVNLASRESGFFVPLRYLPTGLQQSSEKCRLLLMAGADAGAEDLDGYTPLHGQLENRFCGDDLLQTCELLLSAGANPNAVTSGMHGVLIQSYFENRLCPQDDRAVALTPLHCLLFLCYQETRMLIDGWTDWRVLRLMIDHGADPNFVPEMVPPHYLTPFQMAVNLGMTAAVMQMIEMGRANITQKTLSGITVSQLCGQHAELRRHIMSSALVAAVGESVGRGEGEPSPSSTARSNAVPL